MNPTLESRLTLPFLDQFPKPLLFEGVNLFDIETTARQNAREFVDDDKGALRGLTGQVLAIGITSSRPDDDPTSLLLYDAIAGGPPLGEDLLTGSGHVLSPHEGEAALLNYFWGTLYPDNLLAGFCIFSFDLPFLIQRSVVHEIPVPPLWNGAYWSPRVVDLKECWAMRSDTGKGGLSQLDRLLGGPGKTESGADFGARFTGTIEERMQGMLYLAHDLQMTGRLWKAMEATMEMPPKRVEQDEQWWPKPWKASGSTRFKR
ncbi:MAG: 3'-5' exonuclease family protein [Limisphaerales bacterium]